MLSKEQKQVWDYRETLAFSINFSLEVGKWKVKRCQSAICIQTTAIVVNHSSAAGDRTLAGRRVFALGWCLVIQLTVWVMRWEQ